MSYLRTRTYNNPWYIYAADGDEAKGEPRVVLSVDVDWQRLTPAEARAIGSGELTPDWLKGEPEAGLLRGACARFALECEAGRWG